MAHDHAHHHHDHGGHGHVHAAGPNATRRLALGLALTLLLAAGEIVAGVLADSVALLSDAAHNVTDAVAIALALVATRLAARPPRGDYTFGFGRTEVLSAQVNGGLLLVLGAVLGVESFRRLADPGTVDATAVALVGVVGFAANAAVAALLHGGRRSLAVEGAMQHVLMDLWGSAAAVVAGVGILLTGWDRLDPILALVVVALMLRSGVGLMRDTARVLLEASPRGLSVERIGTAMIAHPGVVEVHDLHVWEVTTDLQAVAAHVVVEPDCDCHDVRRALGRLLADDFGLRHSTLQVDHATRSELLRIEPRGS